MNPIPFKGQSAELKKPASMTDAECSSLPILRIDNTVISCWRMSWRERVTALITGKIWLGVLSGQSQPPVYLTVEQPFKVQNFLNYQN